MFDVAGDLTNDPASVSHRIERPDQPAATRSTSGTRQAWCSSGELLLDNWMSGAAEDAPRAGNPPRRTRSGGVRGGPGPRRVEGLNENYARELLELHTLGVDGGYTQDDVVEVARAFTGPTNSSTTVRKSSDSSMSGLCFGAERIRRLGRLRQSSLIPSYRTLGRRP